MIDPVLMSPGFVVGTLIGLSGVGGLSPLTPLPVLVAGINPVHVAGTALAIAAVSNTVGTSHATLEPRGG